MKAEPSIFQDQIVAWRGLYANTMEYFSCLRHAGGYDCKGLITGVANGLLFKIEYAVESNSSWSSQQVNVGWQGLKHPTIRLSRNADGLWSETTLGAIPDSQGCSDINLSLSPSTHTFPLKRLALSPGQAREVRMLRVDLLTGKITVASVEYKHISGRSYKIRDMRTGVETVFQVDESDWIIDFPDFWKRSNLASDFFTSALTCGASDEIPVEDRIYDFLLGTWNMQSVDYHAEGQDLQQQGECHFCYTLEGRAVQDLWIFPSRNNRSPDIDKLGNRYGTTIRMYDFQTGLWRIFWLNPVNGTVSTLTGRRSDNDIVQTGWDKAGNPIKWVFTDIATTSFRWYAARSVDNGKTWKIETEFFGTK
jgi:hypothetical protein